MAYQRAYLPTKHVYISQGYGMFSKTHKHSYALDLSGDYKLFAPFDCKVTKLYVPTKNGKLDTTHSFEVWLTSTKKVLCSNGVYDYLTISLTHPKGISKLTLGQEFKQFDDLGLDTRYMTGVYSGNHCHIELSLGKKAGWDSEIVKKYGDYVNVNKIKSEDYLFITEDTKVFNEKYKIFTYHFKKESEMTYLIKNVPSEPLNVRDPKTNKVIGGLYNGDEVLKFNNKALIYHYEILGNTVNKYLKKCK